MLCLSNFELMALEVLCLFVCLFVSLKFTMIYFLFYILYGVLHHAYGFSLIYFNFLCFILSGFEGFRYYYLLIF